MMIEAVGEVQRGTTALAEKILEIRLVWNTRMRSSFLKSIPATIIYSILYISKYKLFLDVSISAADLF